MAQVYAGQWYFRPRANAVNWLV